MFPHKQALFGCAARYLNCNPRNCVTHLRFFYFESLLGTNQSDPALPVSAGCHLAESLSSKLMFMCRYAKITDAAEQNENYCRSLQFRRRRCIWTPIHYLLSPSMLLLQIKVPACLLPHMFKHSLPLSLKRCSLAVYWWISIKFHTLLSTAVLIWKPPLSQTKSCPETHVSSYCCPLCAQLFNFIL